MKQQSLPLGDAVTRTPRREATIRRRDEIWDALGAIFGEPTTRTAEKVRGKVVSSLRYAHADPAEIEVRAKRWPLHFDRATLTDLALEKHWDTLGRKPLRRQ